MWRLCRCNPRLQNRCAWTTQLCIFYLNSTSIPEKPANALFYHIWPRKCRVFWPLKALLPWRCPACLSLSSGSKADLNIYDDSAPPDIASKSGFHGSFPDILPLRGISPGLTVSDVAHNRPVIRPIMPLPTAGCAPKGRTHATRLKKCGAARVSDGPCVESSIRTARESNHGDVVTISIPESQPVVSPAEFLASAQK